jgi:hypothetical protein
VDQKAPDEFCPLQTHRLGLALIAATLPQEVGPLCW